MRCAVLGFGNPVRGDDAIGCIVIEKLKPLLEKASDKVSLFDMGTNGFEVLFTLPGHTKIIVVDGVLESAEHLGSIYKVPAEKLLQVHTEDPLLFLHGMKWNQGLSYAKKIMREKYPNDISAYLVSIINTSIVEKINPEVEKAGEQVVEYIYQEIEEWLN